MKIYKGIDVFLQTGLIIISILGTAINNTNLINPVGYIITLGLIQAVSILVHLIVGPLPWKKRGWRKIHHIGTLFVLLLLIIVYALESSIIRVDKNDKYAMPGIEVLLYTSCLAIILILFYTIISWAEWRRIPKE